MKILFLKRVPEALEWARERLNIIGDTCGPVTAVSLVDDNGAFQAVTVYSSRTQQNVDMHIAALRGSNWASRSYFLASFELPFEILQVPRVTALVRSSNRRSEGFLLRLGFIREGYMRCAFPDGEDLMLFGFLREEYLQHPWRKYATTGRTKHAGEDSTA